MKFKVKAIENVTADDINYPWVSEYHIMFEKEKIYDAWIGKSSYNRDIYYLTVPLTEFKCMLFPGKFNRFFINISCIKCTSFIRKC